MIQSQSYSDLLICPAFKSVLSEKKDLYICENPDCKSEYPVYNNIPVMISPKNIIFSREDFKKPEDVYFKTYNSRVMQFLQKIQPELSTNLCCKENYTFISEQLAEKTAVKILIIGGSIDGKGIGQLKNNLANDALLIEADISYGPNTKIIFDSHEIPLKDEIFDLIVVQAVLEHVLDPFICVAEIYRVLKSGGLVYAETPFMQQVHGGKYDFHRFTHLGHRRLFRKFVEIKSGIVSGAGSSLAWSLKYLITSFATNKKIDKVLSYASPFLFFWVKYFDLLMSKTRGSLDSACGYFFIGQKEPGYILSDKELLDSYRGLRGNVK